MNGVEGFWDNKYGDFHVFVDYIDQRTKFQIVVRNKGSEVDAPRHYKHSFWTVPRIKKEIALWFIELGVWNKKDVDTLIKDFSLSLYHKIKDDEEDASVKNKDDEVVLSTTDVAIATNLLTNNSLIKILKEDMDKVIIGENENKLLLYIIYMTAFLKNKIHPRLSGDSSGGKSHLLNGVSVYLPDETILFKATRVTGKALEYHLAGKDLNDKIMLIQEFEGGQDAIVSMRPLMSGDQEDGGLSLMTTKKDAAGNIVQNELKCTGTPLIASASTQFSLDGEFETRTWKFEIDDSESQTRRIMEFLAEKQIDPELNKPEMTHHFKTAIRYLRDFGLKELRNIWAMAFQESIPNKQTRIRRDMSKLFALIEASAYFHQLQRPRIMIDEREYIIPTIDDFEIASKLYRPSSAIVFNNLSKKIATVYKMLKELSIDKMVGILEIAKRMKCSQKQVYNAVNHLVDIGLAYSEQDPTDKRKKIYYVSENEGGIGGLDLKEFSDMFPKESFIKVLEKYYKRKKYKALKYNSSTPEEWKEIDDDELYELVSTRKLEDFDISEMTPLKEEEKPLTEIIDEEIPERKFEKIERKQFLDYAYRFKWGESKGFTEKDMTDYFGEEHKMILNEFLKIGRDEGEIFKPYDDGRFYSL